MYGRTNQQLRTLNYPLPTECRPYTAPKAAGSFAPMSAVDHCVGLVVHHQDHGLSPFPPSDAACRGRSILNSVYSPGSVSTYGSGVLFHHNVMTER